MPAAIRVMLSEEEDRTLKELSYAEGVSHRIKQRALAIRLNARGWNAPQIAQFLDWHEHSVRNTLERWNTLGLGGLWEQKGRGRKRSRT
ncbi:helix-turn-helix domain-containing protein [Aliterella atlantica]|uniref:helix-turn-helix domain-containing protein n=1 Tax=Aliterella atlantica TaxID=1827278 RepID=UPI000696702A|nr:helix-turn-helix domain-containing protein [Aliterella atlantica]